MDSDRMIALFDEATARRVLLVRAVEAAPPKGALWSSEDRTWASRLASETAGAEATPRRWLEERTRHACERLLPRDASLAAWLRRRGWRVSWLVAVAAAALLLGLLADSLVTGQHIDLLAPPLLGLLAWNLGVYALFAWRSLRGASDTAPLRRLARRFAEGRPETLKALDAEWAARAAPLAMARAALLLHLSAAALACGLLTSLYLRGLVLDFRAGWQSTFLDAPAVHALLGTLLAPASALTGIVLPDLAALSALRIEPGRIAHASAAPWIHLFAATLALGVIAPRVGLAAWAAAQAWWRGRHIEIDLSEPYFQRLFTEARRGQARVQVLPHGEPPSAQTALGLRALLAAAFGEPLDLRIEQAMRYGQEGDAAAPAAPAEQGATLRIALFDLAATPEPEAQGRFVRALLASRTPLVLLTDQSGWTRRFATLPQRLAERVALWQRFAAENGIGLVVAELDAATTAGTQDAAASFGRALDAGRGASA